VNRQEPVLKFKDSSQQALRKLIRVIEQVRLIGSARNSGKSICYADGTCIVGYVDDFLSISINVGVQGDRHKGRISVKNMETYKESIHR